VSHIWCILHCMLQVAQLIQSKRACPLKMYLHYESFTGVMQCLKKDLLHFQTRTMPLMERLHQLHWTVIWILKPRISITTKNLINWSRGHSPFLRKNFVKSVHNFSEIFSSQEMITHRENATHTSAVHSELLSAVLLPEVRLIAIPTTAMSFFFASE